MLPTLGDFGKPFRMPPRQEGDPDPVITAIGDNHLVIRCGDQTLTVSGYNAARILGALAIFLNARLAKQTAKRLML